MTAVVVVVLDVVLLDEVVLEGRVLELPAPLGGSARPAAGAHALKNAALRTMSNVGRRHLAPLRPSTRLTSSL